MTLAETMRMMAAAGFSAEQIAAFVANYDEARRAKARDGNRQRQASFRDRRNANNAVTGRDAALSDVTGRDEPLPKAEPRARVLYGEELVSIPPSETTSPLPPVGADGGKRGRRITAEWRPSEARWNEALLLGLNAEQFERIVSEFVNYWLSETGARARKLDWDRTFQNRLRDQAPRYLRGRLALVEPAKKEGIGAAIRNLRENRIVLGEKPPALPGLTGGGTG